MTPVEVVTQATFPPMLTALIVLTTAWYLVSVRRLAAKGRPWPARRTASLCLGQLLLAVGLLSGLDAHERIFRVDAVQLILIAMLAPIFLAVSAPVTLLLQTGSRRVQTATLKVLQSPAAKVLSHPAFTWSFYGASLFVLYFSGLYADALRDETVQQLVQLELVLAGCVFWWPPVGVDPAPYRLNLGARIFYLLLVLPLFTILGMSLESQSTAIAPGMSLVELHSGGGLIWAAGTAIGLAGTLILFVQWLRADESAAKRNDQTGEVAAAVQLAHWRATRDAAARAIRN